MGISPDSWGPYVWAAIHLVCIGAPDVLGPAEQMHYKQFFMILPDVIPCGICSDHLRENLQKLPVDQSLASSKDMFKWSVDLHNLVNSQLNKPNVTMADAEAKWRKICDTKATVGSTATDTASSQPSVGTVVFSSSSKKNILPLAAAALGGALLSGVAVYYLSPTGRRRQKII
jgi:hypothetical protein